MTRDQRRLSVFTAFGLVACLTTGCFESDFLVLHPCKTPSTDCDPASGELGQPELGCFTPESEAQDGHCTFLCSDDDPCPEVDGSSKFFKCVPFREQGQAIHGVCGVSAESGCPKFMKPVESMDAEGTIHALCTLK